MLTGSNQNVLSVGGQISVSPIAGSPVGFIENLIVARQNKRFR